MRKVNLITVLTFGVFIACNTSKTENHVSNNNETKVKEININSKFQIFTTAKDTNLRLTKTKAGVFLFPGRKAPPWVRHEAFSCCRDITNFAIVVISHTTHKTEGSPGNVALHRGHESARIAESPPARRRWRPQAGPHTKTFRFESGGNESLR